MVSVVLGIVQYNFIMKRIKEVDFGFSPVTELGNELRFGITEIAGEIKGLEDSLREVTEEAEKIITEEQEKTEKEQTENQEENIENEEENEEE